MSDVDKLVESLKCGYKSISHQNGMIMIELNDGTIVPLVGGGYELTDVQNVVDLPSEEITPKVLLKCSFCNKPSEHVISPPNKEEPLICPSCAKLAVETFVHNGITIDLTFKID